MCGRFECIHDVGGMCEYYSESDYCGCECCEYIDDFCSSCTIRTMCTDNNECKRYSIGDGTDGK